MDFLLSLHFIFNSKLKIYNIFFILFTGWQPRWFRLTAGELTYYKSEEEVSLGCKGSVKLCACQILGKSEVWFINLFII